MAEPFIGEIRPVPFNFAPVGWAICDGSLLSIAEYDVLFNLIGTTFGGDGVNTFALPDLRGRVAVHQGTGFVLGQRSGSEQVALTTPQIPAHTHNVVGTTVAATTTSPVGAYPATSTTKNYAAASGDTLAPNSLSLTGSTLPHDNMQPSLVLNYVISLFGIYPTQN